MINHIQRDITTVMRGVILHGVNCSGVAYGAGVAGAIRLRWNEAYGTYMANGSGIDLLGTTTFTVAHKGQVVIANGYTQNTYGRRKNYKYADLSAILKCFSAAATTASTLDMPLFLPKIGCGLGGLSWEEEVLPAIDIIADLEYHKLNIIVCSI